MSLESRAGEVEDRSVSAPVAVPVASAIAWWDIPRDGLPDELHDGRRASDPRRDGHPRAEATLAAVNFAEVPTRLPPELPRHATVLMSTDPDRASGEADLERFILLPGEAVLLLMQDGRRGPGESEHAARGSDGQGAG